jgi:hypothetical protein
MSSQNWECRCGTSNAESTKFCGGCGKKHLVFEKFTGFIQLNDKGQPNIENITGVEHPRKRIPFVRSDNTVRWATLWPNKEGHLGDSLSRIGQHFEVETSYEFSVPNRVNITAMRVTDTVEAAPETQKSSPPNNSNSNSYEDTQMRIMRQSTLKCASWIVVPMVPGIVASDPDSAPLNIFNAVCELSEKFLGYVITGEYDDILQDAIDSGAVVKEVVADEQAMMEVD